MTTQYPIHPPTELVRELWDRLRKAPNSGTSAAIAWTEAVARAAIREVAAWLRTGRLLHAAELLELEADRG